MQELHQPSILARNFLLEGAMIKTKNLKTKQDSNQSVECVKETIDGLIGQRTIV